MGWGTDDATWIQGLNVSNDHNTGLSSADLADRVAALERRLEDIAGDAERIRSVESMLRDFLPRPDGRWEYLAQHNVADLLAWRAAFTSAAFVEESMLTATVARSRQENIVLAARNAPPEGLILEFGVGEGTSLGWLHSELPGRRVVGFDSFEGLPEDWRSGFPEGFFGHVSPEDFDGRRELCVGWFENTVPDFFATNDDPIALLHVDCDLYSSTVTVLDACMPRLVDGAVVVFDEFFNYPGWEQHEAKAWREYLTAHPHFDVEYVGYVPSGEQISVRVNRTRVT